MRINENGRSMIEMLGVLAIIGVLSVGGIAGYSKAMAKFRSNKTIDQISHIVTNIRILFGSQKNYADLGNNDGLLVTNASLFPDEMHENMNSNDLTSYKNPYAGGVTLWVSGRFNTGTNKDTDKAFIIRYDGIPQAACVDLASQDWNASSGSGLVAFGVNADVGSLYLDSCTNTASTQAAANGAVRCVASMPMPVGQAAAACGKDKTNNYLTWKFY